MAKIDNLKTAKRHKQLVQMFTDNRSTADELRKANVKERQKGRQIIREEIKFYEKSKKLKI